MKKKPHKKFDTKFVVKRARGFSTYACDLMRPMKKKKKITHQSGDGHWSVKSKCGDQTIWKLPPIRHYVYPCRVCACHGHMSSKSCVAQINRRSSRIKKTTIQYLDVAIGIHRKQLCSVLLKKKKQITRLTLQQHTPHRTLLFRLKFQARSGTSI